MRAIVGECARLTQVVDLGGENKIADGEAIALMVPEGEFDFAPGEVEIRVVLDFLGELANFDGEGEGLLEVFEFVFAFEVVALDDFPGGAELVGEFFDFGTGQRWDGALGGDAGFVGECIHVLP